MMRTKIKVEEWNVELGADDDGHLTIVIDHEDKSKVIALDSDISINDEEWAERFTTKGIEAQHIKNCELGDNWKECPACIDQHNSTCKENEKL